MREIGRLERKTVGACTQLKAARNGRVSTASVPAFIPSPVLGTAMAMRGCVGKLFLTQYVIVCQHKCTFSPLGDDQL